MADAEAGGNGVNPPYGILILLVAVAVHAPLVIGLSLRGRSSYHRVRRYVLSCISAMYFPLMSAVLSYLPTYLSSMLKKPPTEDNSADDILKWLSIAPMLLSLILIQILKANADMAALAMSAVTSPVAGDDIDRLKIRPSVESLISSSWVAGLVIYSLLRYAKEASASSADDSDILVYVITPLTAPLWILAACRMVLRFASFKMATRSFAVGHNMRLIEGYMVQAQLQAGQSGFMEAHGVPRLIVTGERDKDVEPTPEGYQVASSALDDQNGSLVTLDRVWSCPELDELPELKDLCLSFALFKCLRRRLAGHRLAEAGTRWALDFVCDGLLGDGKNHKRIFRVIADELSFVRGFYYAHLPVASLGTTISAALHLLLSLLISALLCFITLLLLLAAVSVFTITSSAWATTTSVLAFLLGVETAGTEIWEMVDGVRSNWTKISIIGQLVRCRRSPCWVRRVFMWLLTRCKPLKVWKDKMGQINLLEPIMIPLREKQQPRWAYRFLHRIPRKNPPIVVPLEVKEAILASLRSRRGQLRRYPMAMVMPRYRQHYITTEACHGSGSITHLLLVWHIATSLFEIINSQSQRGSAAASSSSNNNKVVVAKSLSRYCAYLVVEAPDLLPDLTAWIKRFYKEVKKGIEEEASRSIDDPNQVREAGVLYRRLITCFSAENSHDVLKEASKVANKLVEEAERPIGGSAAGGVDAVWGNLAEFWSEMLLYLAPSDDVKHHIEALQRGGGELITLLRALLLHAGITSRQIPESPDVLIF